MEQELADLKKLTGFSEEDFEVLKSFSEQTSPWIDEINQAFYDTLYGYEPTAKVFVEGERPAREKTLIDWYSTVVSGEVGDKFWMWQWLVGMIHIKRRVSNSFMFGMVSRVQQLFLQKSLDTLGVDDGVKVYNAFKRVTDVVAGLIAESFFSNFVESLEQVLGFNRGLVDRMMDMEVEKRITKLREQLK